LKIFEVSKCLNQFIQ